MFKRSFILNLVFLLITYSCIATEINTHTMQEEEFYKAHRAIIDSLMDLSVPEKLAKIYHYYKVPRNGQKKLKEIVKKYELELICQDIINKDSLNERVKNKIEIESCYRDSINSVLITETENHITGENLSYALHCSDLIKLDRSQYDYIMTNAIDMARRIRADFRINVWNEEMDVLKNTLDKQQFHNFFYLKNAQKVTREFDEAWKILKENRLTEQIDSLHDAEDAINYMFTRQMIKDVYRFQTTRQRQNISELERNKPKIIKLLDGIEIKERIKRTEQNRVINKEFIW